MPGYIFLGRQRPPWKLVLFQLLTLGIYGRVYLYKILREFDGHEALFLDRRPYIPLLILPFIGPLFVKRKVTNILVDLAHHDVTTPRFRPKKLNLLAWVPLAPLYHLELQRLLNHHWNMHRKEVELELKRAQLASLQRSRSEESVKEAQTLTKEIVQREKELDDVKQAAGALREAELVRLEAERAVGGRRRNPMALVRKLRAAAAARLPRRQGAEATEEEEAPEEPEPAPKGRRQPAPEPGPEPGPEEAAPEPEPEEPKEEAPSEEQEPKGLDSPAAAKRSWSSFVPFLGKKAAEEEPAEGPPKRGKGKRKPAAPPVEKELSRVDRKESRRKAKAEAKAAKVAAKEKAKEEKLAAKETRNQERLAAKEAKRAEKEAAKEAKAQAKAKKKAAKEKAKAEAKAAKKKEKAGAKKPKARDKKEKSRSKAVKSKGSKGKARPK